MRLTSFGMCGAYPKENMGTSCYYVETDVKLVFDMGSGSLSRLSAATPISEISALFITHFHSDHIADVPVLRYFECFKEGARLNVYMPKDDCVECSLFSAFPQFIPHFVSVGDVITVGRTKVLVTSAFHVPNAVGYKIFDASRSLYYTGDTVLNREIIDNAENSSYILADCFVETAGLKPDMPHMSVSDCKYLANAAKAKLLCTHVLSSHYDKVIREAGRINVIQELLTYEF